MCNQESREQLDIKGHTSASISNSKNADRKDGHESTNDEMRQELREEDTIASTNRKSKDEDNSQVVTEEEIFDINKVVKYSSDEESNDDEDESSDHDSNDEAKNESSTHDSSDESSDDCSTDSSSDDDDDESEETTNNVVCDDEINEDETDGPIISKNEIVDFKVPTLPTDYKIEPETNIQYVGKLSGVVEKNVMIECEYSAEEKVLGEGTVFCTEDRQPLGLLYEVIGRLQSPVYTMKFNSVEEAEKFRERKGQRVYFIVPTAEILSTRYIKSFKGTDASNCHDEELPEEEQEYSDDEKEAEAKKNKKRKRKQVHKEKAETEEVQKEDRSKTSQESKKPRNIATSNTQVGPLPKSVKARLTSLPAAKTRQHSQKEEPQQNKGMPVPSIPQNQPPLDNMSMIQQFMGMLQQAASLPMQPSQHLPPGQNYNPQYNTQYNTQYNSQYSPQYSTQYSPQYSSQYNSQGNSQYNLPYNQQYSQSYDQQYVQNYNPPYGQQYGQAFGQQLYQPYGPQFTSNSNNSYNVTNPSPAVSTANIPNANPNIPDGNARLIAQIAEAISKNPQTANLALGQLSTQTQSQQSNSTDENPAEDVYDPAAP